MVEEMNQDSVLDAVRKGSRTVQAIHQTIGVHDIDRSDLQSTIKRMIGEGALASDGKNITVAGEAPKVSPVPPVVSAKTKLSKNAEEPKKPKGYYMGKVAEDMFNKRTPVTAPIGDPQFDKTAFLQRSESKPPAPAPIKSAPITPPSGDAHEIPPFLRRTDKAPTKPTALSVVTAKLAAKGEDLDGPAKRASVEAYREKVAKGEDNLSRIKPVASPAPKPAAPGVDPYAIPDFMKRTNSADAAKRGPNAREVAAHHMKWYDAGFEGKPRGGNEAEQAAWDRGYLDRSNAGRSKPAETKPSATAEKDTLSTLMRQLSGDAASAKEAEGPPKSPHYKPDDEDGIISRSQHEYGTTGHGATFKDRNPASFEKALGTIERVLRKKFEMGKAIAKEVPNFDMHDFTDRLVHSRTHDEGAKLSEWAKAKYPGHDDVFDRMETNFEQIYPKSKKKKSTDAEERTARNLARFKAESTSAERSAS